MVKFRDIEKETEIQADEVTRVSYDGYNVLVKQLVQGVSRDTIILPPYVLDKIVELKREWEKKYGL